MPLIHIKEINAEASWALWKITEDLDELSLLQLSDQEQKELEEIHNQRKRMEWLAARSALHQICGTNNIEKKNVLKDVFGKPFLFGEDHQISLAHSFPYAVALFNRVKPAGIDLERVQEKILKIGKKFLNVHEKDFVGSDVVKMTIVWCAKEALYKLYGRKRLIFKENLFVDPFEPGFEGDLMGTIKLDGMRIEVPLYYLQIDGFVVCYTK